jgi:hypothetical protein
MTTVIRSRGCLLIRGCVYRPFTYQGLCGTPVYLLGGVYILHTTPSIYTYSHTHTLIGKHPFSDNL